MAIALYELAKHVEVQNRMLDEIHSVVGQDRTREIQTSELRELSYMDRVVKEILRLYPAVPFIERQLKEDVMYSKFLKYLHNTRCLQIALEQCCTMPTIYLYFRRDENSCAHNIIFSYLCYA